MAHRIENNPLKDYLPVLYYIYNKEIKETFDIYTNNLESIKIKFENFGKVFVNDNVVDNYEMVLYNNITDIDVYYFYLGK